MHRVLLALGALAASTVAIGCGGGATHHQTSAPPSAVTEQVRQALVDSLKNPALPDMATAQRLRLPYLAVGACTGLAGGRAGRYKCETTPRGSRGIRSITVQVAPDGTWSTQPLPVEARVHGHQTTAVTSVWGFGIRIPS
jgi:hypothetical protein